MLTPDRNTLLFDTDNQFEESIAALTKMYFDGDIFILPTDSSYCLCVNPFIEGAIVKLKEFIKDNLYKDLIFLIDSISNLIQYTKVLWERHIDFLMSVWPNPVNILFKLNEETSRVLGVQEAAFRIPDNRFCLRFLAEIKKPLMCITLDTNGNNVQDNLKFINQKYANKVNGIFYSSTKVYEENPTLLDLRNDKLVLIKEEKLNISELIEKHY